MSLRERGRYAEAERASRRCLAIREKLFGPDHLQTAICLNNLAIGLPFQGKYSEAEPLRRRSLAIYEKVLGPEHSWTAMNLSYLAILLQGQGKRAEAEPLFRRAFAIYEKVRGPNHFDAAASLHNLACLLDRQGRRAEAEPLYRRALATYEKARGPNHPGTATILNNLAVLLRDEGKPAEAESLFRRALTIQEKALGPDHLDTATSLEYLASLLGDRGKCVEAEPLHRRALAIREKALGPNHPGVAASLNELGYLRQSQGRYAEAEPLHRRALSIRERQLGPEHRLTALSLSNLGKVCESMGKTEEAERLHRRALAIREKVLGADHADTVQSLSNLAGVYGSQSRYAEAEPLCRRALAIQEKMLGQEHRDVALSLEDLAGVLGHEGKYAEAEPLFRRALAIREKVLGPNHHDVAVSLNNLAVLYSDQGRSVEAEPLQLRALAIVEKARGPDHSEVATFLSNLAPLYHRWKPADAERLHRRALAVREKAQGPDHTDVARSLGFLAILCTDLGKYAEAEPLHRRALAIREKALGPDHPDVAASLTGLAYLMRSQGKYAEAESLLRRALAIDEKVLGPDHPHTAICLDQFAAVAEGLGDLPRAWEWADRTRRIFLRARSAAAQSPLTRAALLSNQLRPDRLPCLALALGKPVDVLALVEEDRALGLRELLAEARVRAVARLPREDQERVAAALGRLNTLAAQVEKLAAKGLDTAPARQELQRAEMDYDALMADLLKRHEQFVATETASAVTSEQIAKSELLRNATAIVGWVAFRKWAWGFVARREGVFWVDLSKLGEPETLEKRVVRGLSARAPVGTLGADLSEVYRCRFQPLELHLRDIRRIVVIAQGWAAVLPAEALLTEDPAKAAGGSLASAPWLADRYEISYAPSATTLDILCRQRTARAKKDWERPLFALADPPFSGEQLAEMQAEKANNLPRVSNPREATGEEPALALNRAVRFNRGAAPERLPGTRQEVEALATLLGREKSLLFLGPEASERKLFEASTAGELAKCRYIHLATHGLADGERPELSALLLARATEDPDYDGLLQMREVFHLKLDADLVVLSACQSGLGKQLRGEGMVGLSTAFFFAGTPLLVVSLWKVPDDSTVLLMRRFYANLAAGQEKSAALREAKAWLRNLTREEADKLRREAGLGEGLTRSAGEAVSAPKGRNADDRPFAHPHYWAPFVLTGDPR